MLGPHCIADYPGYTYHVTNNYDEAMALIRLSNEHAHYQVVRPCCALVTHQEQMPSAFTLSAPPSYPHPAQPAHQQNLHAASESSSSSISSADKQSTYYAPDILRPFNTITLCHPDLSPSWRSVNSMQSQPVSHNDLIVEFQSMRPLALSDRPRAIPVKAWLSKVFLFPRPPSWGWW